jgi:hypothetical protein
VIVRLELRPVERHDDFGPGTLDVADPDWKQRSELHATVAQHRMLALPPCGFREGAANGVDAEARSEPDSDYSVGQRDDALRVEARSVQHRDEAGEGEPAGL